MEHSAKQKSDMARLMELALTKKVLILCAGVLSTLAAFASFIPYIAIYFVIKETLTSLPDTHSINSELMIRYGWFAFAGVTCNVLLYFAALVCSHLAAFGTLYELKIHFAKHLAKVPLGFHVLVGSGKLRKIADENIEKIEGFIAHLLPDLVAALVAPVVMIFILLIVDWRLGLASLAGMATAFYLQAAAYGNEQSKLMMEKYQAALEAMNNASVEYVRGIAVVKVFQQTVYSFRRLFEAIRAYKAVVIPYTLSWKNSFSGFVMLVNNIYLFVVPAGILIGMQTDNYVDFAGKFIFYLIFVQSASAILMKIMYLNSNTLKIMSGIHAMDALFVEKELNNTAHRQTPSQYGIDFVDVSFSYDKNNEIKALSGISFTARQGEITAIVGPSGGGKSTIAHLIPRFFDVDEGQISIGGIDVRDMDIHELMNLVSFVFQDVFLFKQSIMNNIRMGKPNASDNQVIQSAQAACCHEFIMELPNKYETIIGTRGVHLSGGERQRVAIARAIIKDAPIVVLDEATAFADPENEHLIQKSFATLLRGKTVVMIAHRLATVRRADSIVVIDEGYISEQGTHDELLQKNGKYSAMWNTYMQTISWAMKDQKELHHV